MGQQMSSEEESMVNEVVAEHYQVHALKIRISSP